MLATFEASSSSVCGRLSWGQRWSWVSTTILPDTYTCNQGVLFAELKPGETVLFTLLKGLRSVAGRMEAALPNERHPEVDVFSWRDSSSSLGGLGAPLLKQGE